VFSPPLPLLTGVRGITPENFLKLHMHAGEFYNIFNTKINTMQVKVFCLETLVSSRPVNAGCSFIETSQIENKYDYDIIRDNSEFSLLEFWDPFWRPLGAGARGKCPPPRPSLRHCTGARRTGS
jgi:hypothetical protein